MARHRGMLLSAAMKCAVFLLGATASMAWAKGGHDKNDVEIPFAEAFIFFELNNTDGDLGIHGKLDGGPWTKVQIEDHKERRVMSVRTRGRFWRQGITELFFESAEPPFDELTPEKFFRRFPEGTYDIEGLSQDGEELESETELTHVMPAPPVPTVNGAAMAEQCDDEEPGYDAPELTAPVVISWADVTMSHPDLGTRDVDVTIVNYQVVVETDVEIDVGEEFTTVFSVVLPPGVTSMTVPAEFLAQSDSFKYEVLAREETYNQTAIESCFDLT